MVPNSACRLRVASSRIWPASSTPVGPAPTRAKVSQRRRSCVVGSGLGHLERAEQPTTDRERVGDRLHPGCPLRVLVVAEVGLPDAGRDDEVVVRQHDPVAARPGGDHPAALDVHVLDLGEHAAHVAVPLEDVPQRCRDLTLGEDARRALVEQRLEQVVPGAVDEGDVDRRLPQRPGREQPGETAADDHDAWPPRPLLRHRLSPGPAQPTGSYQDVGLGQQRVGLLGPPAAPGVGEDRRRVAEHGLDHPPGGLDRLLAGEQPPLAVQRGADQAVVGPHVGRRLLGEREVLGLRLPAGTGLLAHEREADLALRPDPEPQPVGGRPGQPDEVVRRLPELEGDLGGGDRHALAGPDEDRDVGPAPRVAPTSRRAT